MRIDEDIRRYIRTGAALMCLLVLTVVLAHAPLGPFSTIVALAIAATKAVLVGAFFMHLKFERPIVRLFALSGAAWLALLIGLTLTDVITRGWGATR